MSVCYLPLIRVLHDVMVSGCCVAPHDFMTATWSVCSQTITTEHRDEQLSFTAFLTLTVLVATIDAQWEGMGDVGSARYEPATTSPMPDHKGFKLQYLVNFQKLSTLRVNVWHCFLGASTTEHFDGQLRHLIAFLLVDSFLDGWHCFLDSLATENFWW